MLILLVGVPVLMLAVAVGYKATQTSPGGEVQMPSIQAQFRYPSGWKNSTNDDGAKKQSDFDESFIKTLPEGSLDAFITNGRYKALVIFSAKPNKSITASDFADEMAKNGDATIIDPVSEITIAGERAYRATAQTQGSSGLFGSRESYGVVIVILERKGRIVFAIGGSTMAKFDKTLVELDAMINGIESSAI